MSSPPFYARFIKRDEKGSRTHHIHMVEAGFEQWDRLLFRDHLIANPELAAEFGDLKMRLSAAHHADRVAYTEAQSEFIRRATTEAKKAYGSAPVLE